MTREAASLVAGAKQWASYYGDYPNGEEGAVLTAPLRIRAAWAANDAEAFAHMFIENGSMLVGDRQLMNRDEIRSYMAEAFGGAYKGSRLTEEPREIRLLTGSVAVAIMEGGILRAGADSLAAADEVRAMWVVVRHEGDWRIASYQTSPIKG
ncbi:MAG: SgcJ/EcaC family oxidoreductase [Actinobacteria bacterium]|nr:SgcJ/EcaC family oxidoreductase [Actinomycetota bacterium]MBI3686971.1 SgcJ/EcaC family oxidoreductase [Actinomycetota bacterium]